MDTITNIPTEPIVLHHLNNSRSQRIIWLLEELKLNYTVKKYQRGEDLLAPKELSDVHPLGKSPVITDGGLVIAESGAIIEYLVDTYGQRQKLKPTVEERDARLQYTFWLHFAEASLMTPLLLKLVFDLVVIRSPFLIRLIARGISNSVTSSYILPNATKHFAFIESHLEKNPYFAGTEFSAADIQMSFGVQGAVNRLPTVVGPVTREWLKKVEGREAYKQALEKGGQYDL